MTTYQPPTIPFNLARADPSLKDLLDAHRTNILNSINCHAIATIQSFAQAAVNGAPNGLYTVSATINYSKTYFVKEADGTYQPQQQNYPILVDVPAIILGGGSTYLTFPITVGDQCLILFNDKDLNNWFAGANTGPVATPRSHSLADGIALVGFAKVPTFDSSHALLSNGNAEVGVPSDATLAKVRIANNSTTLYTLLAQLITAIEGITVSPGSFTAPSGGGPVTGTSGTVASTTALNNAKTALAALLE